jgi:hypothetical protein
MEFNPPALPPVQAPPEPRRFYRIAALMLSVFSPALYRDVGRRWRGIGFWYLVLLLFVCWLPVGIKVQVEFARFVRQDAPRTLSGFPGITITDGVVSIDRPEPYLWRDPDSHDVILYVDTSGAFDLSEGAHAKVRLSRSRVMMQQSELESRTYDLSQIKSFSVDRIRVLGWFQTMASWIGLGLFIICLTATLIWHLIQIVIYGVIGLLFAAMFQARLEFPALMRLAAVTITPAILLDTVFNFTGTHMPYSVLFFLAIELGYLGFAVKANADSYAAPAPPTFTAYPPPPPL